MTLSECRYRCPHHKPDRNDSPLFNQRLESRKQLSPEQRLALLITQGEDEIVAAMAMTDFSTTEDAQKRQWIKAAMENKLKRYISASLSYTNLHDDFKTVIDAQRRKIKSLVNGHKEGEALVKQLEQMYPYVRAQHRH